MRACRCAEGSLDAIAQGFITDCVAGRLRVRGIVQVLLELGEMRALGPRSDGKLWRIGIADPRQPAEVLERIEVLTQQSPPPAATNACSNRLCGSAT